MLKLQINRFMLRHEGKTYCRGDVVELPDELANALVEKSAGAYSLVSEIVKTSPSKKSTAKKKETKEEKAVEDVTEVLAKATKKAGARK